MNPDMDSPLAQEIRRRDKRLTDSLLRKVNEYRKSRGVPFWHLDSSASSDDWTVVIDSEGKRVTSIRLSEIHIFLLGAECAETA